MPTPAAVELLAALSEVLRSQGCRWYLFGAQAVLLYGEPRLTADVDVTVEVLPARIRPLVDALEEVGFRLRVKDADAFVARTSVLPFEHAPSGLLLDLVLAGSGLEELFLGRARSLDIGGLTVPVIAPDDLIVTKVLAGRPKDLEDARGVLTRADPGLDLAHARRLLRELEAALDRSDLMPVFEILLARAGRSG